MYNPTPVFFFPKSKNNNNNNSNNNNNAKGSTNLKKSSDKLNSLNQNLRQNESDSSFPHNPLGKIKKSIVDNTKDTHNVNTPSPTSSIASVSTMVNESAGQSTISLNKSSISGSHSSNSTTNTSAPEKHLKPKKHVFKTFGKKAALLAGDIAFGSAYTKADDETQRKANMYYQEFQAQRKAAKLEEQKLIQSADITDKFLDELRFYMKFVQESEFDDSLNYANSRKDIWNDTYRNFLVNLRKQLQEVESNLDNPYYFAKYLETDKGNDDVNLKKNLLPHLNKDSYLKDHNNSTFAKRSAMAKQKTLSNLNELTQTQVNETKESNMLQQRQLLLVMSWMTEISCKLLGHPSPLLPKTKAAIQKVTANIDSDPSKEIDPPEICTVIGSHNFESDLEYSGENRLNFLQGWNLRFKEPEYYVNSICIASNMQTIFDLNKHGYLKDEDLVAHPNFYDSVLEKMEKKENNFLDKNEQQFLSKYSMFTTTSATKIPLSDNSQAAVHCIDFTSLIPNMGLEATIAELYRILKPKGAAQLIVRDIAVLNLPNEPTSTDPLANVEPDEFVAHKIWNELGLKATALGYEPQLTGTIVPALYKAGFTKVSYNVIAYPQVSSLQEEALPEAPPIDSVNVMNSDYSPRHEKRKASIAVASKNSTSSLTAYAAAAGGGTRTDSIASSLLETNHHHSHHKHNSKVIGYKDNRANDFFELYSNYMEFKTFFKFTGMNVKKMVGDYINKREQLQEEIDFVKLFIDYKFNGSKGELVRRRYLPKRQQQQQQHQSQFLTVPESSQLPDSSTGVSSTYPVSPSSNSNSNLLASGSGSSMRNEGVAYILVVIAEK